MFSISQTRAYPSSSLLNLVFTVGLIKTVDLLSPNPHDGVILQLTRSFGITLIDLFQGLGIMLCLAYPLVRTWGFWRRGGRLVDAILADEQAEHRCIYCNKALQPVTYPS